MLRQCLSYSFILLLALCGRVAVYASDAVLTYQGYHGIYTNPFENKDSTCEYFHIGGNHAQYDLPPLSDISLTTYHLFSGYDASASGARFYIVPQQGQTYLAIHFALERFLGYGGHEAVYDYIRVYCGEQKLDCEFYYKTPESLEEDLQWPFHLTKAVTGHYQGWLPWQVILVDVSAYIGQSIMVEAVASCCSNVACTSALFMAFEDVRPAQLCTTCERSTIKAPVNASSYKWHKATVSGTIVGEDPVLTVKRADANNYYCSIQDYCGTKTICLAESVEPVADFEYRTSCSSGKDTVFLKNNSFIRQRGLSERHPIDTLVWDFGDGRISSDMNLPYVVFDGQDNYTIKLKVGTTDFACDSILTKDIIFPREHHSYFFDTICREETPYFWQEKAITESGDYLDTITTSTKCDSILHLSLKVLESSANHSSFQICQGDTILWLDQKICEQKTYHDTLINMVGCDSILSLSVTFKDCSTTDIPINPMPYLPFVDSIDTVICKGDTLRWRHYVLTRDTMIRDTGYYWFGADSVYWKVDLTTKDCGSGSVTIVPTYVHVNYDTLQANPYLWEFDQKTYTEPGFYADTIIDVKDTTIGQLLLTVDYERTIEACVGETVDSIATPWGTFGFDDCDCLTGCIKQTLDSICIIDAKLCRQYKECACDTERVTMDITLPYDTLQTRGGYMWFGEMRDTAGVYRDTIKTVAGCDSIGLLILRTQYADSMQVCGEDTAVFETPWGKYGVPRTCECMEGWIRKTADDEGLVYATLCVTRLMTDIVREDTTLCYGTSIVWHGITVDQTKEYEYHEPFTRLMTCDSVVFYLDATIKDEPKEEPTVASVCAGETYTWTTYHDSLITEPGTYYDTLKTADLKCDSIHYVLTLTHKAHSKGDTTAYVCYYDLPYIWHGDIAQDSSIWKTKNAAGCDSTVYLHLVISSEPKSVDADSTICSGDMIEWHHQQITTAGIYYDTARVTMGNGTKCDSIWYSLTVKVQKGDTTKNNVSICVGNQYMWKRDGKPDRIITDEGEYWDTVRYVYTNCDSMIYYLNLKVEDVNKDSINDATCKGTPYRWRGQMLYTDSVYRDTAKAATPTECDTVYILNLAHLQPTKGDTTAYVCYYDLPFIWRNDVAQDGDVRTIKNVAGCDSVVTLKLYISPEPKSESKDSAICLGDMIEWHGKTITTEGEYLDTARVTMGDGTKCDSIWYSLNVKVLQVKEKKEEQQICTGGQYVWKRAGKKDSIVTTEGEYYDTVWYVATGCDSMTYYLKLTVGEINERKEQASACEGSIYTGWRREIIVPAMDSTYRDTVKAATLEECDTVFILNLRVNHATNQIDSDTMVCYGHNVFWRNRLWVDLTKDSILRDTIKYNGSPCDSIRFERTIHVRAQAKDSVSNEYACYGADVEWRGQKLMNITATQTLTDKVSYEGTTCDSIRFEHTIHVLPKYTDNKEEQICTGGQYVWKRAGKKDSIITVEGEYYDTVRYVATGCDSMTYYLKLTVGEINERKEQASACEGSVYTGWRREIIVPAMDSTYRDTVKAATLEECDTVFILNMTVLHKTSGDTIAYVCEGSTFYWRGQIAHHGDQITLTNAAGCDSIVTLHLTIKDCGCPTPTIKPTDVVYICDTLLPYKWLTYREIMVYRDTLLSDTLRSADNKCDSIIYTLDLSTYHCCQPLAGTMEVRNICADERVMDVIVKLTRGHFSSYRVHYTNAPGNTMPFRDTLVTTVPQEQDGHVLLTLPVPHDATDRTRYPRPDQYGIEITLYDVCGNHLNLGHQTFDVYYPSWILDQHWDDVIAILNDRYNGGYTFSRIEWLRDGEVLPGEKELYIYMPHQLWTTADEQHRDYAYQALLTRSDDGKSILSCPMHPEHKDSTNVMTEPYVFVSPTLVPKENPIVHVQTNTEGTYWLYDPVGKLLHTADYEPCEHNVFDIELHYHVQTMYILVFTPRNETRPLKAKYRVVKLLME